MYLFHWLNFFFVHAGKNGVEDYDNISEIPETEVGGGKGKRMFDPKYRKMFSQQIKPYHLFRMQIICLSLSRDCRCVHIIPVCGAGNVFTIRIDYIVAYCIQALYVRIFQRRTLKDKLFFISKRKLIPTSVFR